MSAAILFALAAASGPIAIPKGPMSLNYPPEAIANRWEGRATYSITVDPKGKAVACRVTQSTGHRLLDDETCKQAKAMFKFKPAKDDQGAPVTGTFTSVISWQLPK